MRTTLDLDLDDDVLASAKEIARREKKTAGQVLSELARRSLTEDAAAPVGVARDRTAVFGALRAARCRGHQRTHPAVAGRR